MFFSKKKLTGMLVSTFLAGSLAAETYTTTNYYVAYDSSDATQYVLVMPSAEVVMTHRAADIVNVEYVTDQFESFPTFSNGEVCFSALASDATGDNGASTMAAACYTVGYYYIQKSGSTFFLYSAGTGSLMEGTAGDSTSFSDVSDDYTYTFDTSDGSLSIGESDTPPTPDDTTDGPPQVPSDI